LNGLAGARYRRQEVDLSADVMASLKPFVVGLLQLVASSGAPLVQPQLQERLNGTPGVRRTIPRNFLSDLSD